MLYDFECSHGHRFEYTCAMADRLIPISCQGTVNQLADDVEYDKYSTDSDLTLPEDMFWMNVGVDMEADAAIEGASNGSDTERMLMRHVPCMLQAEIFTGSHTNIKNLLFYNLGANRDAAREGRYDPDNPSKRFISKGRGWRK